MPKFDAAGLGSQVIGIAGMGIGIGILAHTAKNITKMTDKMYKHSYKPIKIKPIRRIRL